MPEALAESPKLQLYVRVSPSGSLEGLASKVTLVLTVAFAVDKLNAATGARFVGVGGGAEPQLEASVTKARASRGRCVICSFRLT
jgi:hypothetical protein